MPASLPELVQAKNLEGEQKEATFRLPANPSRRHQAFKWGPSASVLQGFILCQTSSQSETNSAPNTVASPALVRGTSAMLAGDTEVSVDFPLSVLSSPLMEHIH